MINWIKNWFIDRDIKRWNKLMEKDRRHHIKHKQKLKK